jgi:hypothetical protein
MRYLVTDPMKKLPAMLRIAEKLDQEKLHASQIQALKQVLLDKNSIWHDFVEKMIQEVERKVLARMVESFIINANLKNAVHTQKLEKQYGCNIPWAILLDPTSACNLSCTGCWAAQYGGKNNLSNEMLESIVSQGKELGVFSISFPGVNRWYANRISFACAGCTRIVISLPSPTARWWTMHFAMIF